MGLNGWSMKVGLVKVEKIHVMLEKVIQDNLELMILTLTKVYNLFCTLGTGML
jgi:hypothetical protein